MKFTQLIILYILLSVSLQTIFEDQLDQSKFVFMKGSLTYVLPTQSKPENIDFQHKFCKPVCNFNYYSEALKKIEFNIAPDSNVLTVHFGEPGLKAARSVNFKDSAEDAAKKVQSVHEILRERGHKPITDYNISLRLRRCSSSKFPKRITVSADTQLMSVEFVVGKSPKALSSKIKGCGTKSKKDEIAGQYVWICELNFDRLRFITYEETKKNTRNFGFYFGDDDYFLTGNLGADKWTSIELIGFVVGKPVTSVDDILKPAFGEEKRPLVVIKGPIIK
jgi:hypothetical protein